MVQGLPGYVLFLHPYQIDMDGIKISDLTDRRKYVMMRLSKN